MVVSPWGADSCGSSGQHSCWAVWGVLRAGWAWGRSQEASGTSGSAVASAAMAVCVSQGPGDHTASLALLCLRLMLWDLWRKTLCRTEARFLCTRLFLSCSLPLLFLSDTQRFQTQAPHRTRVSHAAVWPWRGVTGSRSLLLQAGERRPSAWRCVGPVLAGDGSCWCRAWGPGPLLSPSLHHGRSWGPGNLLP